MGASKIESEYNEINSKDGWMMAFQSIKEKSEQEAKEKQFTLDECNKINNRRWNRYRDVSPYDHSRIVLQRGDVDYINANVVKMEKANRKYILTQGPLAATVGHFWLMVWEQNSAAILMLNKLIEKKQVKCHQYWPEQIGPEHIMNLTDVDLTVEYLKCEQFTNFAKRTFRLTDTESNKSREVIQFHYTTWPDFCIPSSPIAFLQFLKKVRDSGTLESNVGPAVVHCSAGIGRSGTFCLVDSCLVMVDKEGENKISVADLLLELRRYRMGLIQTADQLFFSYQAIIEGIKHLNDPTFNDYEEVPIDEDLNKSAEDVPPPRPPQRIESLVNVLPTKPLPTIPTSASAHEFLQMEARNNSENLNRNLGNSNRPLPPLPPREEGSLERLDEDDSDSDGDEDMDDEDQIEEIYSDEEDDDDEEEEEESDDLDENNDNNSKHKLVNGSKDYDESFDADATLPPSPSKGSNTFSESIDASSGIQSNSSQENPTSPGSESSNANELRRRKRLERQTAIEEKIRDIKRKQKASEAAAAAAPKKRRSLMIFSGVVICVLCCAFVYTKFG